MAKENRHSRSSAGTLFLDTVARALPDHCSVEEAKDFSSNMLGTGLVVVHDTLVGGEYEYAELTGGQHSVGEILELSERQIEARRDDTALVEAAVQVDDDLASTCIVDDLKFVDVTMLLHDFQELDEHLGCGPQDNLNKSSG